MCVSLVYAGIRPHSENHHAFVMPNDRLQYPSDTERQRPTIRVEYFENGTTIATYADGTPVVRPATAITESHYQLTPSQLNSTGSSSSSSTRLTGTFVPRRPRHQIEPFQIVFPGDTSRRHDRNATIEPKCLSVDGTKQYCTNVEDYPSALIEKLLSKSLDSIIFKSDAIDNELGQRFGPSGDEPLCEFKDEVIYPESGLSEHDIPFFIVNTQQQQGVRVERCLKPDKACSSIITLPNGYTSKCRQNYVYRELISPSNDLTALEKRKFKFPSCCSCVLQRV